MQPVAGGRLRGLDALAIGELEQHAGEVAIVLHGFLERAVCEAIAEAGALDEDAEPAAALAEDGGQTERTFRTHHSDLDALAATEHDEQRGDALLNEEESGHVVAGLVEERIDAQIDALEQGPAPALVRGRQLAQQRVAQT